MICPTCETQCGGGCGTNYGTQPKRTITAVSLLIHAAICCLAVQLICVVFELTGRHL